jgi:hypothetical protein
MGDIIDELRQMAGKLISGAVEDGEVPSRLLVEAADRIEALEAALRALIDNIETGSYESTGQAVDVARAALAPEQNK